jgi:glycosyltransferase involved in cell wall biosynthesis
MIALHAPVSASNPYQELLLRALAELGVEARGVPFAELNGFFPLRRHGAGRAQVTHLHWVHGFYQSPGLIRSAGRALFFLLELLSLRLGGARLVWTVHDRGTHDALHPRLDRFLCRCLVRLCHDLTVHCQAARDWVVEEWGAPASRVRVIPHGSFLGYYPDQVGREAARQALGLDRDARVILAFGSIRADKGLLDLLAAFRRLPDPGLRLLIAGWVADPAAAAELREAAQPEPRAVLHLERVPAERVQYYFRAADLAVAPYREILTSGAVVLAQAFALPMLAPAVGCLPEQVGTGGIVYDPASPRALADALVRALAADLAPLAAASRARAEAEDASWQRVAKMLLAVYEGRP